MDLKKCESCGMPMVKLTDFGGMKKENDYCRHCTYEDGMLRPRHEVREGMILYYMKTKRKERSDAESYVDEIMAGQRAWG
ncbi:MAG: zinc ribbon domain-containing protein [Candidatus Micrarchaeota archaeon]